VRVVAGSAGGRLLRAPDGTTTRPTSDRVREAMFNALGSLDAIEGATVLDLYAGSGALGIEALSRGAVSATFLETAGAARRVIEDNLATTGLADRATVVAGDALGHLERTDQRFDLILADPPYGFEHWPELGAAASARLAIEGLLVAESDHEPDLGAGVSVLRSKRYGGTVVVFARHLVDLESPGETPAS
jgi:16S rRNA (guanine966-N2)-methyltransferase